MINKSKTKWELKFKDRFQLCINNHLEEIATTGFFGSQEDDVDILVVGKNRGWRFFENLCSELRETFPDAIFYPSFRLQQFATSETVDSADSKLSMHFLYYPSIDIWNIVERPFIRFCIAKSFRQINQGEDAGSILYQGERPVSDLSYYENLLYETGQLVFMKSLPMNVLLCEVRHKLNYIVKFSLLEVIYREDFGIDLKNILRTLLPVSPRHLETRARELLNNIGELSPQEFALRERLAETYAWLNSLKNFKGDNSSF